MEDDKNGVTYACANCDWRGDENEAKDARDLYVRMEAGDTYTDKECPECGALAFPVKEAAAEPITLDREHLAALAEAARVQLEDLESGVDEGVYDDSPENRANIESLRDALAGVAAIPETAPAVIIGGSAIEPGALRVIWDIDITPPPNDPNPARFAALEAEGFQQRAEANSQSFIVIDHTGAQHSVDLTDPVF